MNRQPYVLSNFTSFINEEAERLSKTLVNGVNERLPRWWENWAYIPNYTRAKGYWMAKATERCQPVPWPKASAKNP